MTGTPEADGDTAAAPSRPAARRSGLTTVVLLLAIVLLGAYFRTLALTTWDEPSFRLHPDERFFTDVASLIRMPESLGDYFDSSQNTLNPRNRGKDFYVYGLLPQTVTRLTAVMLTPDEALPAEVPITNSSPGMIPNPERSIPKLTFLHPIFNPQSQNLTDYYQVFKVGRSLSVLWDLCSIVVVFLIGRRLYGRRVGLLASLLLALSVLPIQLAHFFTVDAMTALLTLLTIYWAVRVAQGGGLGSFALMGLSIGGAMACRVTLATLGLVGIVAVAVRLARSTPRDRRNAKNALIPFWSFATRMLVLLVLAGALSALTFRVLQPDAFMGSRSTTTAGESAEPSTLDRLLAGRGFFDVRPEPRFIDNIQQVGQMVSGEADMPPSQQWVARTPFLFSLQNMVLWGMGLPLGLTAWAAWALAGWQILRRRALEHLIPWTWIAFYFAWQGGQFVMTMRYYSLLYGLMAIFAAWLLVRLYEARPTLAGLLTRLPRRAAPAVLRRAAGLNLGLLALAVVVVTTGLWAYAFTRIYTEPHSRVAASRWIYANIPPGATITAEEWDDPLPLSLDGRNAGQYTGIQMRPYFEDDQIKYIGFLGSDNRPNPGLLDDLDKADYLIFSSNRVYDSATRMPARYPALTRYYYTLFSGSLGFKLVADIHSYPRLFGVEIPTSIWAEEAFSVYDHPRVLIFQKTPDYSRERAERLITGGVVWEEVYKVSSLRASKAPTALRMTDEQWSLVQGSGTWTQLFNPQSLPNALPWLFWLLALEVLGLAAFALLFRLLPGLPDRGFALSKTLGLLALAYLAWLLASIGAKEGRPLLAFSPAGVWLCAALLVIPGALAGWRGRAELLEFARRRRTALLTAQGLFLIAYLGFVVVRALNPDLWHYARGGEKPMDLAFLTAVVKSPSFPPYDPWFAGGYLNYYYFGFVLVGVLIQLTGLPPAIAYNLAIPTVFALTALGAWGALYNLLAPRLAARRTATETPSLSPDRAEAADAPQLPAVPIDVRVTLDRPTAPSTRSFDNRHRERRAILSGVAAAIFVVLLGNLSNALWLLPGTGEQNNPTLSPECQALSSYALQQNCRGRTEWAFWDATRIVGTALKDSTITEFPFFTFIYGDLHAHMLSLPLALAALGLMVALVRARDRRQPRAMALNTLAALPLLALVIGALRATNTWDFPTYTGLAVLTLALLAWDAVRSGTRAGTAFQLWVLASAALVGLATLLFLPFTSSFATEYASFELWTGTRTPGHEFLQITGLWLFLLFGAVLVLHRRVNRNATRTTVLIVVATALMVVLPLALNMPALFPLVPLFGAAAGLLVNLMTRDYEQPDAPLVSLPSLLPALWALAALGLTLLTEVLVTKGDIGRMNTVFKFGMQSWVLFALCSAAAFVWLWERARTWHPAAMLAWRGAAALLVLAALVYPATATPARLSDRYDLSIAPTLDGTAFMRSANSNWAENDKRFTFAEDADALDWIRQNIPGTPVVLEAQTEGYRWGGRVSIYTGLPTVLGWPWHETQQRSVAQVEQVLQNRKNLIQQLYNDPLAPNTLARLQSYGVEYVYVGQLERALYSAEGLAKFDQMVSQGQLQLVYAQGETRIYRVAGLIGAPGIVTTTLPLRPPTLPPAKTLMLERPVEELPAVQEFAWNPLASSQPLAVLLWLLFGYLLLALGLPLALLVFGRWRDAGVGWARLLGLLLLGYAVWLPVSARLMSYDRAGLLIGLVLVLLVNLVALALLGRRALARQALAAATPLSPAVPIVISEDARANDPAAPAGQAQPLDEREAETAEPQTDAAIQPSLRGEPAASFADQNEVQEPAYAAAPTETPAEQEVPASRAEAPDETAPVHSVTQVNDDAPEQPSVAASHVEDELSPEGQTVRLNRAQPERTDLAGLVGAGLREVRATLRERRRAVLQVEALFLAVFAVILAIRALNPDLWQPVWGGEKPFEFGFLNAVLRSPVMPPYNPFYSDGIINYYYYGLFLVSLPIKAIGVAPAVGFNLAIPLLFGLTVSGAFTLLRQLSGRARYGLVGAAFVALLGNLAGFFTVGWSQGFERVLEALTAGDLSGFGARLSDWFIGPSRVIPNTINEFPFWSFLFADLHPHLIALPVTLLAAGLGYVFLTERRAAVAGAPLLAGRLLAALVLGTLAVTNSWDFPTYALLLGGALLGAAWVAGRVEPAGMLGRAGLLRLAGAAGQALAISLGALLLFLPFFQNYQAPIGGIGRVQDGTQIQHYLVIYGVFLAVLLPAVLGLAWRFGRQRGQALALEPRGAEALGIAATPLAEPPRWRALLRPALALATLLGIALAVMMPTLGLKIWLGALLLLGAALLVAPRLPRSLWFALWLAWVGWAVSLGIEFVFVRDHLAGGDWYRMNTVFKFGFQIWSLLALAAAAALPWLLRGLRRIAVGAQIVGGALLLLLVMLALIFPLAGTPSRVAYRFPVSPGPTLDGLAFLDQATYSYNDRFIDLQPDAEAIRWLNENVKGAPVVLQSSFEFYRAYGVRIAANTGLPTVVSPLHETEQRDPTQVGLRDADVNTIYNTSDLQEALRLLSKYRVEYLYVGPVERAVYGEANVAKFDQLNGIYLSTAYSNRGVKIYQVNDSVAGIPPLPQLNGVRNELPGLSDLPPVSQPPAAQPSDPAGQPALADLEAQFQANPKEAGPAFALALRYRDQGRANDAAETLRQAAEANPGDIALHHLWGDLLRDAGRFDEAEAAYTKATEAAPTSGNYNKLAFEQIRMNRLERAEASLRKALEVDPAEPGPFYSLGLLYETQGQTEQALLNYQEFVDRTQPGAFFREEAEEAIARLR
ncbi:MAG TPA: DUF2298 domain-containing protein [Roseiflexaceae bacterium]|nr:DUF2298 domain-containing protein [Roseiflexaceae bacterium]